MWATLLIVLTMLLFLVPLIPALQELHKRRDVQPLTIVPTHHGNIHQFAESFRVFIERELSTFDAGTISSKWGECYAFIGEEERFWPSAKEAQRGMTQRIVVAEKRLTLPDNFAFQGEIYGQDCVRSGLCNQLRGILVKHDLVLQRETVVLRWAHARSAYVAEGCLLFGRFSVEKTLVIDLGCRFMRIHAPCVKFGTQQSTPAPVGFQAAGEGRAEFVPDTKDITRDGRMVLDQNLDFPENSFYRGDMVICGDITIGQGSTIIGSIKSHGNVTLGPGVHIGGALVCGGSLMVGSACTIGGPVISENEVEIGSDVAIGSTGKPTTVTAATIRVTTPAEVHGTVWAREEGVVMPPILAGGDIT